MMEFTEKVTLDFKESELSKDGIRGLLEGFENIEKVLLNGDEIILKHFSLMNIRS